MSILKVGEGTKIGSLTVTNSTSVSDNPNHVAIDIGDKAEINQLLHDNIEAHTHESYRIKLENQRSNLIKNLEIEIAGLKNQILQAKLNKELEKAKNLPINSETESTFKIILSKIKEISIDFGAKVISEIITKSAGI